MIFLLMETGLQPKRVHIFSHITVRNLIIQKKEKKKRLCAWYGFPATS